jgi:hypothetical protein
MSGNEKWYSESKEDTTQNRKKKKILSNSKIMEGRVGDFKNMCLGYIGYRV